MLQWNPKGGSGGADVLEGGCGREIKRGIQFPDQRPGVERVQQVDVARLAVDDAEGQGLPLQAEDRGRLLVWIAAVLEIELRKVGADDGHAFSITGRIPEPRRFRRSACFSELWSEDSGPQSHLGIWLETADLGWVGVVFAERLVVFGVGLAGALGCVIAFCASDLEASNRWRALRMLRRFWYWL